MCSRENLKLKYEKLYREFYNNVDKTMRSLKAERFLSELNIEKDYPYLRIMFLKEDCDLKNIILWNDDEWINYMKHIRLGVCSFLYKTKITFFLIYEKASPEYKELLFKSFKNLVEALYACVSIETELLKDHDRQNKRDKNLDDIYFYRDIMRNPEAVGKILDLITQDKNILINIVLSLFKISSDTNFLNDLLNFDKDNENMSETITKLIEKYMAKKYIDLIVNCLMSLEFDECEIIAKRLIYNKVEHYLNLVIKNSITVKNYFKNLNDVYKMHKLKNTKKSVFKEKTKLKIIDEQDFYQSYIESLNFSFKMNQMEDLFKLFENSENIEFPIYTSYELMTRVKNIFLMIIEKIMVFCIQNKDKKVEKINLLYKENIMLFQKYFKNIKPFINVINDISDENIINIKKNEEEENDELSLELSSYDKKEDVAPINRISDFINGIKKEINNDIGLNIILDKYDSVFKDMAKVLTNIKCKFYAVEHKPFEFKEISNIVRKIVELDIFDSFVSIMTDEKNVNKLILYIEKSLEYEINIKIKKFIIEKITFYTRKIHKNIVEKNTMVKIKNTEMEASDMLIKIAEQFDRLIVFLINTKHMYLNNKQSVKVVKKYAYKIKG